MDKSVQETFGNRFRVRVCGLCWQSDRLLLVSHAGLRKDPFWAPPGGGMEFGFTATENLVREFREETGLRITTKKLAFVTEYLQPPLHALELFYEVEAVGGKLKAGTDPELGSEHQMIRDVRFLTVREIDALAPEAKHGLFRAVPSASRIRELNGYFQI